MGYRAAPRRIRLTVYANLALDPTCWLGIPAFWGGLSWSSADNWAAGAASDAWTHSGLPHDAVDVDRLAAVLVTCCEKWGPGAVHPEQLGDPSLEVQTALHLPDPRMLPFPARVIVADAAMVNEEKLTLHDLVDAEDPRAINPPKVEEIVNPNLGPGLMAYRLRPMETEPGEPKDYEHPVYAVLRYAFPVPGHDDKILVSVSWPDIARITAAREDIDNLARGLTFEYHPD